MIGIRWTADCNSQCTKRLLADHRLAAVFHEQSLHHHRSQVAPIEIALRRVESDAGQIETRDVTKPAGYSARRVLRIVSLQAARAALDALSCTPVVAPYLRLPTNIAYGRQDPQAFRSAGVGFIVPRAGFEFDPPCSHRFQQILLQLTAGIIVHPRPVGRRYHNIVGTSMTGTVPRQQIVRPRQKRTLTASPPLKHSAIEPARRKLRCWNAGAVTPDVQVCCGLVQHQSTCRERLFP